MASTPETISNTQTPFAIRFARALDAESICRIGSTVFAATFGHSLSVEDLNAYLDRAYSLQSVLDTIANASNTVCVACDPEDEVLGFAVLTEGTTEECIRDVPAPVELQRLYVDGKAHGKGVGGALVRFVEGVARKRGFHTCWLGVWEYNYTAQKVYERLGYARVGEHDFVMGKEVQTDWIMTKAL